MALFPEATFKVLLPETGVVPGAVLEGLLEVEVPLPIPRAGHLELFYITRLSVDTTEAHDLGYEKVLFVAPLKVHIPAQSFPAGRFQYPFAIAIPPWLPPPYVGAGCTITHAIEVRLAVDWAIDPTQVVVPTIYLPPTEAVSTTVSVRSPSGFHESLVIDVTLEDDTIAAGRSVRGQLALRGGHDAKFTGLKVILASMVRIRGTQDQRRGMGVRERIPAGQLRSGASVPFKLRHPVQIPPSFRADIVDVDYAIVIQVEGTSASKNPSFNVPVHVLPMGSTVIRRGSAAVALGTERLGLLAAAMADASGLRQGRLPVLVEGRAGCVGIEVRDSPRAGRIGVEIGFDFPDLALGIGFRPIAENDESRSLFLPEEVADRYLMTISPERPIAADELRAFFGVLFRSTNNAGEIRFDDRSLTFYFRLAGDGSKDVIFCARWAKERAEILAAAISRLPFSPPFEASATAWAAMAAEQGAHLYPHVPAIHGLRIGTRIASGEQRELGLTLRTRADGTVTVDVDLRDAPVPKDPNLDGLRPVREVFPKVEIHTPERVSLEGAAFPAVPALLLATLETFLSWLLDVRGERRSDGPYR